jgi:hypothetical protein
MRPAYRHAAAHPLRDRDRHANQQVTDELFITVGPTKWQLNQI